MKIETGKISEQNVSFEKILAAIRKEELGEIVNVTFCLDKSAPGKLLFKISADVPDGYIFSLLKL